VGADTKGNGHIVIDYVNRAVIFLHAQQKGHGPTRSLHAESSLYMVHSSCKKKDRSAAVLTVDITFCKRNHFLVELIPRITVSAACLGEHLANDRDTQ